MKTTLVAVFALGLIFAMGIAPVAASGVEHHGSMNHGDSAFHAMHKNYEQIRLILIEGSLDGVAKAAHSIADRAGRLASGFDAEDAGVSAADAGAAKVLLPKIEDAAERLSTAADLDAARAAFGDLSEAMVSYRNMIQGEKPMVVFCPMVKKKWLQPGKDIGNPYGGKDMTSCGEIVSE